MSKLEKLIKECSDILGTNKLLAAYLGVHERTVYRWLSGEVKPGADHIMKMLELSKRI
jgi:DNA-binding transcriptional regulator YdaS (Cro superfamily)